jgi:hypothetical protein
MKLVAAAVTAAALSLPLAADAATLLTVDLTTVNSITIMATNGVSAATISGLDRTGFLLAGFFSVNPDLRNFSAIGDLTSAQDDTSGLIRLFSRGLLGNVGLNIHSFTNSSNASFSAGQLAFEGSVTWSVDAGFFAAALAGPSSGSIFFAAEQDSDIPNATNIGSWEKVGPAVIPLPSTMWLSVSALALLGCVRARKRQRSET